MPSLLERAALTPKRFALMIGMTAAFAVGLAESYRLAALIYPPLAQEPWLGAALIHSVLSCAIVMLWIRKGGKSLFLLTPLPMYLPALVVLLGVSLMVILSRLTGGASSSPSLPPWGWIVWVPLVEELVFRAGIGAVFRRISPGIWGAWFSALTFALVHASPTLEHVLQGNIGLVLGPFLLGLACEALVAFTGRIAPAIALHAACNATVVIFSLGDRRWLEWLGFLYN